MANFGPTLIVGVIGLMLASGAAARTMTDEFFVGPMPTWRNLQRDFGAVGDGVADDTDALQRALDSVGTPDLACTAIWVPAGTYRIKRTLVRTGVSGVYVIGEDPRRCIIRWDGPAYGGEARVPAYHSDAWKAWDGRHAAEMLWFNGRNSRFERLTFDGAGKAASGFSFKWHDRGDAAQTSSHRISLADVTFRDIAIGFDGGGKQGWLDSEVLMERCRFERCTEFGVGLHHFNAVDYWLWHCVFEDCGVAVSNEPEPHGGVVHVYESIFRRSKQADFTIFHSGFFGLRHNHSQGSRRFVHARNNGVNGALMHLQGNVVVDTIEPDAVVLETLGPMQLTDNKIASAAGASGPVVRAGISLHGKPRWNDAAARWVPVALSAVGNRFTVADPIQVHGERVEFETTVVERTDVEAMIAAPAERTALPRRAAALFPVEPGADAAAIQRVIDAASALAASQPDAWPIVFLPQGRYELTRALTVAAGARIEIAGDGCWMWPDGPRGTLLVWADDAGPGPALQLAGPVKARLRDLGVFTAAPWQRRDKATRTAGLAGLTAPPTPSLTASILATGVDQAGGRVHMSMCNFDALFGTGVLVQSLDQTQVQAIAVEGGGASNWNRKFDGQETTDPRAPYPAFRVVGGPRSGADEAALVIVQGGNTGRWDVRNGGRLVVRDCWYESNWAPFHMFLRGHGRLTLDCFYDAQYTHPKLKGAGVSYAFEDWTGRFTSIAIAGHYSSDNPVASFTGIGHGGRVLFLGNGGDAGSTPPLATADIRLLDLNRKIGGTIVPNPPSIPEAFVLDMLRDARAARVQPLTPTPDDVTDLRLTRVRTWNAQVGLHLIGSP